jgi:uncharacterized membrane protein YeaQ/YmgE (transglycosylase-associated protein family)
MHLGSPALAATLQALRGETDVHIVAPTFRDPWFARVLAFVPNVDPVVGALGALVSVLPNLLTPAECNSPALSAAVASLIGTEAGQCILPWWADVAPAGWGASHVTALIDAVRDNRCPPWAAAALIGPCDTSAALLIQMEDIAPAIQRWGQANLDAPTSWTNHLASAERDRFLKALRGDSYDIERCLPCLPAEYKKPSA